ncbi:MAG TPA: O-methyltransferase [Flavobacteriales bacterium]|nr:O-methyltransferase [Flavobacteriales bacterium]
MNFLSPELDRYSELNSTPEPNYLQELAAETRSSIDMPQMLSGHVQGRFLSLMSKLLAPKLILDIGTFTGYSALCMAEGLAHDGMLHTIDIKTPLAPLVDRYLRKAGFHDRIHQHLAPAMEVIPRIEGTFDLVFIDADKQNYVNYFELVVDRLRPGGLIIADNVLWSGKVLDPDAQQDGETKGLAAYARKVGTDTRVENVLLPLRDGLLVSRRK